MARSFRLASTYPLGLAVNCIKIEEGADNGGGLHVSMNSLIWYPVFPFNNGAPGPSASVPTLLSSEVLLLLGFMRLAHHPQVSTPVLPSWCNLPWPLHINWSQPFTIAVIYCDTLVVSLVT
ncbi:unnamed protein product [Rangifer tarandus platyrhynchus]|uniref:Uncharacterized protein n=2 Tax=Rangifer tarandus platyrhynchus TaxID=3082113 RepID=A0AC59YDG6_RANTA|nr:unnamed protein product [Rangifer tarandus platyrhynchus]